MARYSFTFIIVVLMLCFGIFFGIEMATKGMERIQGPTAGYPVQGGLPQQTPPPHSSTAAATGGKTENAVTAPPNGSSAASGTAASPTGNATAEPPLPVQPPPLTVDSGMNKVGNEIGDMLQSAAHGTIRAIVSMLDSIVN